MATKLNDEAITALRQIIYHRVAMWDAGSAAEKVLGCDVDTQSHGIDCLAAAMNSPDDALTITEKHLREAFGLTDA